MLADIGRIGTAGLRIAGKGNNRCYQQQKQLQEFISTHAHD
jgi:hypothetical protein